MQSSHKDRRPSAPVIVLIDAENRIVAQSGEASRSLKGFLDERELSTTLEKYGDALTRGPVQIRGSVTMRLAPLQGRPGIRAVIFEELRFRKLDS